MKNPFFFKELPLAAPFCNREKELRILSSRAGSHANVGLFSPRRYGKTSLVKRVQGEMAKSGYYIAYINFYGVSSVDELAALFAAGLYQVAHKTEGLLKKAMRFLSVWRPLIKPDPEAVAVVTVEAVGAKRGIDLLRETLEGVGAFIADHPKGCSIVLDEFQEITELPNSLGVEGLLRTHIQTHAKASYFFVGSRRRVLGDMLNHKKRPFYQSAINMTLVPLPTDEAVRFIAERFKEAKVTCPEDIAARIVAKVKGYPYYVQRIPYSIYELCGKTVTQETYVQGFQQALQEESVVFEMMLRAIAPQQIALLRAIAKEPTDSPFSVAYITKHRLGSVGGIQSSLKRLESLDYIETAGKVYQIVDPVFEIWLQNSPF